MVCKVPRKFIYMLHCRYNRINAYKCNFSSFSAKATRCSVALCKCSPISKTRRSNQTVPSQNFLSRWKQRRTEVIRLNSSENRAFLIFSETFSSLACARRGVRCSFEWNRYHRTKWRESPTSHNWWLFHLLNGMEIIVIIISKKQSNISEIWNFESKIRASLIIGGWLITKLTRDILVCIHIGRKNSNLVG